MTLWEYRNDCGRSFCACVALSFWMKLRVFCCIRCNNFFLVNCYLVIYVVTRACFHFPLIFQSSLTQTFMWHWFYFCTTFASDTGIRVSNAHDLKEHSDLGSTASQIWLVVCDYVVAWINSTYPMIVIINPCEHENWRFFLIAQYLVSMLLILCYFTWHVSRTFDNLSYFMQSAHEKF